jgi:O-antigen ligase
MITASSAGLIAIVGLNVINDIFAGAPGLPPRRVALIAVLLAAGTGPRNAGVARPGVLKGGALAGLTLAWLNFLVGAMTPLTASVSCRDEKCGLFDQLFTGAYGNENAVGLSAALTVPFVLLAIDGRQKLRLVAYLIFLQLLSGNRTGLLASTIAVLGWFGLRSVRVPIRRMRLGLATLSLVTLAALLAPFLGLTGLTGRPELWQQAMRMLRSSPLFGLSHSEWSNLADISGGFGRAASYSVHNLFLDVAFGGGLVALSIFLAVFCLISVRCARQDGLASVLLITVAVIGIAERPWSLDTIDWLTWTLIAVIALAGQAPHGDTSKVAEGAQSKRC